MNVPKCATFLGVVVSLMVPAAAEPLVMTIRVLDQAQVSPGNIGKMERYVQATLSRIAIDVIWVDCAANIDRCKALRGRNEFWLRILAMNPPDLGNGTELLGLTQRGDKPGEIPCLNIFYPLVEELVKTMHMDVHLVLGAGVTHEIGHMYLGNNRQAHSETGIMRGVWSHHEFELLSLGELNFTREQGERIRVAMSTSRLK